MRKGVLSIVCALLGATTVAASAAGAESYGPRNCAYNSWMCTEVVDSIQVGVASPCAAAAERRW